MKNRESTAGLLCQIMDRHVFAQRVILSVCSFPHKFKYYNNNKKEVIPSSSSKVLESWKEFYHVKGKSCPLWV